MEELVLKYDSRFVVEQIMKLTPDTTLEFERIQHMNEMFKKCIVKNDDWDKEKLYLLFMFVYYFPSIKKHILEYQNQHNKWIILIERHLNEIVKKHINFEYNAFEFVKECLDLFFII